VKNITTKKKPLVNDASLCRLRGWVVGDVLMTEPTERCYFPGCPSIITHPEIHRSFWKLTAIGERSILVRACSKDGLRCVGPERKWSMRLLDYVIIKAAPSEGLTPSPDRGQEKNDGR